MDNGGVYVLREEDIFAELSDTPPGEHNQGGTTMLAVGTRVKVKGVSASGDSCEYYGEIIMTDNTVYPYEVRTDSGYQGWFLKSAVRAVEKEANQGGVMRKVYCCGVKNDETKIIVSVHDMGESVAVQLHNTTTGGRRLLLGITAKGIVRYECANDDFIALDATGRVAIVE